MPPNPVTHNTLFYGDNLPILRDYIADESVDLVYLDPPFNSNRSYNVLFRDESGQEAEAQITAFDDTWHWNAAAGFYHSPGWNRDYPRLQILTVGDLLHGSQPQMPPTAMTFKQAPKAEQSEPGQPGLGL
jgi:adenine specific DNA methylase Mod